MSIRSSAMCDQSAEPHHGRRTKDEGRRATEDHGDHDHDHEAHAHDSHDPNPAHDAHDHDHSNHDHDHDHGDHDHDHDHEHTGGLRGLFGALFHTHSHATSRTDRVLESSERGIWALRISLAGLFLTAVFQLVIVLISGR